MTGFGSGQREGFRVEIRSLNHRFMDVSMKLPPALASLDIPLRNILKERFTRGKFDVFVSAPLEGGVRVRLNKALARELYRALGELKEELSLSGEIGVEALLNWRELLIQEEVSLEAGPVYEAFRAAVDELEGMRLREGQVLEAELSSRADALEALNREVVSLAPRVLEACRERFKERLRGFLPEGLDEARVLQEASSAAERGDISEEVSRLENHVRQLRKILSSGGTIGRKLDFLLQEINREANTIAAKTDDYRVLNIVIEMKAEAERAREQAQNIQ